MGHDVVRDYRQARRALGVVPQELVFDPFFTVRETLRIQSGYFGLRDNDAWIDEVIEHLDLTDKADANMRSLSGGMKRRVLVAQALVHKPPVIVLDEPTAGVDVELRQALWQFIRELNRDGHTIVLTTHYLEEAEALCGRIAMLKQGRIVALDYHAQPAARASRACACGCGWTPTSCLPTLAPVLTPTTKAPCACCALQDYAAGRSACWPHCARPACGSCELEIVQAGPGGSVRADHAASTQPMSRASPRCSTRSCCASGR